MGRQGPRLVPFLQNGMINKKYRNLISEDPSGLTFSIVLPHKTRKLEVEDELIFKDWYALNGKKYVFHSKHYTDAKQAITASLRKSDYVEKIHINENRLTYRILSKTEVKEKKRLKKELKKQNEVKIEETHESDDAFSSVESGYGSGADSPLTDNAAGSPDNNLNTLNGYESPQTFHTMQLSAFSNELDGYLKSEPMDTCISIEKPLAAPDTPNLFDPDLFTNIQSFADNLKSTDYFPDSTEQLPHCLDLIACSYENPELNSSSFLGDLPVGNGDDILQLDSLSDEDLGTIFLKDAPSFNLNPLVCKDDSDNQASAMTNVHEDVITDELWKLLEDTSNINFNPPVAFEEKGQDQILSSPDAGSFDLKTDHEENIYLCKKCIHLGKIPILFCEPQFEKTTETKGEFKIFFDEAILKEISGFKSVKEYKFISDHLMVVLEPND